MEELQQAQIVDSCRLALPEGLKDLMSDISREVLRARPNNLYQFIADYLSAMLDARDKLSVAAQIYNDLCDCDCNPELDEELKSIGLTDDDVKEAQKVIIKYLEKDEVKEENLLTKLLKTNIEEKKIPAIHKAVRAAFKRNQMKKRRLDDVFSEADVTSTAAGNTLKLYWKPKLAEEQSFPVPDEGQTPYWDSDKIDHERDLQRTKTSSSDSSDDILKSIKYDGGIQDLYVSDNCVPHMNSSLTPLTGSYGTIRRADEQEPNLPEEEEHVFVNYEDDEELANKKISFKLASKEVHTEVYRPANNNYLDKVVKIDNDVENGDNGDVVDIENVEDDAVIAEDESDVSINEELNLETRDVQT